MYARAVLRVRPKYTDNEMSKKKKDGSARGELCRPSKRQTDTRSRRPGFLGYAGPAGQMTRVTAGMHTESCTATRRSQADYWPWRFGAAALSCCELSSHSADLVGGCMTSLLAGATLEKLALGLH